MVAYKCWYCLLCVVVLCVSDGVSRQPDAFAKYVYKSWKQCTAAPTLSLCFKRLSLLSLDHLVKSDEPIQFPGEMVSLVKTEQAGNNSAKPLSENDLEKHLPKDVKLQEKTMDVLLASAYSKFLSTRSVQVKFPQEARPNTAADESRGDKKKGNGFATGAMMVAMTMLPMALAAIGALAGKALMTSMLALMMSALLASRKSHEGGGGSSYEVISIPAGGGHHHHGRNLPATQLAYEAHASR